MNPIMSPTSIARAHRMLELAVAVRMEEETVAEIEADAVAGRAAVEVAAVVVVDEAAAVAADVVGTAVDTGAAAEDTSPLDKV